MERKLMFLKNEKRSPRIQLSKQVELKIKIKRSQGMEMAQVPKCKYTNKIKQK